MHNIVFFKYSKQIIIMLLVMFSLYPVFAFANGIKANNNNDCIYEYVVSVDNALMPDASKETVSQVLYEKVSSLNVPQDSFLIIKVLTFPDFSLVFCQINKNVEKIVDFLQELNFVKYVEKNTKKHLSSINDPLINGQWYLGETKDFVGDINYKEALEIIENNDLNTSDRIVAIIDTGINIKHEDLQDSLWTNDGEIPLNRVDDDNNGYVDDYYGISAECITSLNPNCMQNNNDIMDMHGHGTAIASIISAKKNNTVGIAGLSDAKILTCKITVDQGGSFDTVDGLLCMGYLYDLVKNHEIHIDAVNMSFGQSTYLQAEKDMLELLSNEGVIIVSAGGNESENMDFKPQYPASYNIANLISVGSVDKNGNISYFSNYGKNKLDIFAPGEDIIVARHDNNTGYTNKYGTSFASPIVAGSVPILKAMYPYYTAEEITALLISSGKKRDDLTDKSKTGRIFKLARSEGDTDFYGGLTCTNQIEYGLFDNNLDEHMFVHELNDIKIYGMSCADTYEPDFSFSGDTDYVTAHLSRDDGVFLASYYPEKTKFLYNIDLSLEKEFLETDLKRINLKVGNMEKNIYVSKLDINIDHTNNTFQSDNFYTEYYNFHDATFIPDTSIDIYSCVNNKSLNLPETVFGHNVEAVKIYANNVVMFYQTYEQCVEAQEKLKEKGYYYFGNEGFIPYLSNHFMLDKDLYNDVKQYLGDVLISSGWISNFVTNAGYFPNFYPYSSSEENVSFGIFNLDGHDDSGNYQSTLMYIGEKKIEFAYVEPYAGNEEVIAGIYFKNYPEKNIEVNYQDIKASDVLTYNFRSPKISVGQNIREYIDNGLKFEKVNGQLNQEQYYIILDNEGNDKLYIKTHKIKGDIVDYITVSYISDENGCIIDISVDKNFTLSDYKLSQTTKEISGEVVVLTNDVNDPLITIPVILSETIETSPESTNPIDSTIPEETTEPENSNDIIADNNNSDNNGGGGGGGCSAVPYSKNNSHFIGISLLGIILGYRLISKKHWRDYNEEQRNNY